MRALWHLVVNKERKIERKKPNKKNKKERKKVSKKERKEETNK